MPSGEYFKHLTGFDNFVSQIFLNKVEDGSMHFSFLNRGTSSFLGSALICPSFSSNIENFTGFSIDEDDELDILDEATHENAESFEQFELYDQI